MKKFVNICVYIYFPIWYTSNCCFTLYVKFFSHLFKDDNMTVRMWPLNNFYTLYDAAMLSFTSYTKVGLRLATFLGFFSSAVSLIIGFVYLIMKLINWQGFQAGNAPIVIGVFVIGSIQLFFIGLIGEYLLNMNTRLINRPIVVEEKRLNFWKWWLYGSSNYDC